MLYSYSNTFVFTELHFDLNRAKYSKLQELDVNLDLTADLVSSKVRLAVQT